MPFRSRLMVYGGQTVLGLTNAVRAQAEVTRARRAARAIEMLREGTKTPG
jgi:hypothetical protein